jgi:hypothetical protein
MVVSRNFPGRTEETAKILSRYHVCGPKFVHEIFQIRRKMANDSIATLVNNGIPKTFGAEGKRKLC